MTTPYWKYVDKNLYPDATTTICPDDFGVLVKNAKNLPKIEIKYSTGTTGPRIPLGLDVQIEGIEGYDNLADSTTHWIEVHEIKINIWTRPKPNLLSRIKRVFQG